VDDLGRFCRMLLHGGTLPDATPFRRVRPGHVRPNAAGEATRALGWDMASGFSRHWGRSPDGLGRPHGNYGHVHLDGSTKQDYVIILFEPGAPDRQGLAIELVAVSTPWSAPSSSCRTGSP